MADLRDKVAIVTGASSGIGAAIVKGLLELGMKVVGLARRKEKIEELGNGYEGKLFAVKTDVTKEQDILDALSWTEKNVGPLHVLVNNAGIVYNKPITEAESQSWKNVLDTNLLALTLFTKEAVKTMQTNKTDGFIVNINSVAGHYIINYPGIAIYHASKFGVTAFTESIRLELAKSGSKIRITSISPGVVESEMTKDYVGITPHIKSEDVANSVKYVLTQPSNVNVAELTIRPIGETF